MESSGAAGCDLCTAGNWNFTIPSSNRQLPVRLALDAHSSTLHMFYLCSSYHRFVRKEREVDRKIRQFSGMYKMKCYPYNKPVETNETLEL